MYYNVIRAEQNHVTVIGNNTENFVKFGHVVRKIYVWADRQTDRQTCSSQYSAP